MQFFSCYCDFCVEWVVVLCYVLDMCFCDMIYGGWVFVIDSVLVLYDIIKDLYMYVFVLFVVVYWLVVSGDLCVVVLMYDVYDVIVYSFVWVGVKLLLVVFMDVMFSIMLVGVVQNFVMYLIEVYLVVVVLDELFVWVEVGVCMLVEGIFVCFIDMCMGSIVELLVDEVSIDNCIELGYQFEWFYFVCVYVDVFMWLEVGCYLVDSFVCVVDVVCVDGVDVEMQGVCLLFNLDGMMCDVS